MFHEFIYGLKQKFKIIERPKEEFCTRCKASLPMQKGYSNDLPYWICKGCGQVLINDSLDIDDEMVWICDECGAFLSAQPGFTTDCGEWACTDCGFVNKIDESETYESEDEFQASLNNPYKGLTDEQVLELSGYEEIGKLGSKQNVFLVKEYESSKKYVKKYLKDYDLSVYEYLFDHPVENMPKIEKIYEGTNNLVIIEEYIDGETLEEVIHERGMLLNQKTAINVAIDVLEILAELHDLKRPIIHRDVKPANVILSYDGKIYLLDMNVAKWYKEEEIQDTKLFATQYYAAPEQFGYGFSASSEKTDIYAVGVLLNEMITGCIPKEVKAEGPVWDIIEKSISLDPELRYTAHEMIIALGELVLEEQ